MRNVLLTISALFLGISSFAISAITGTTTLCVGRTTTLFDGGGGTWSSSDLSVATVSGGSTSAVVTGVTAGTAVITFWLGSSDTTTVVTVFPSPTPIVGSSNICPDASETLTDATPGGTWSSSNVADVAVGSTTGVVNSGASGGANIYYTLPGGCQASTTVQIYYVSAVSGSTTICLGSSVTLTDGSGTWSSSNPLVATVGSTTGVVTGIALGTSTISYTDPSHGCIMTLGENVTSGTSPISGSTTLCTGIAYTSTLSDAIGGGTWSSSDVSVATVGLGTGVVTGVSAGTASIVYTTACGAVSTVVTINSTPSAITGLTPICAGGTVTLNDATSGGTWVSSNPSVANIGSTTGVLTGTSSGGTRISYEITGGCMASLTVNVIASVSAISGLTTVCPGGTTTLTDATSGGTWLSGSTGVATVGSVTGAVTGVAVGTSAMTYSICTGCSVYATVTVGSTLPAITGTTTICAGHSSTLSDATGGGTWTSSNTAVATVIATTGVVTGVSAGTASIIYTTACGAVSAYVTINQSPASILGSGTVCAGGTETLTDATTGGTWSGSTSGLTIGSTTGLVTGITSGTGTNISYTLSDGCLTTLTVSVVSTTAIAAVSGPSTVCTSSTITLTDGTSGGTWSSSNTAIATVTGAGVVTGVSAGTASIIYTVTEACGTVNSSKVVTVGPSTSAGIITGSSSVNVSGVITLTETVSGGTWSSSNPSIATVGTTGVITGIAPGTATITYTVIGCSSVYTTFVITVTPIDGISGYVVFPAAYYGTVKVWLITYNPGTLMLEASDSVSVACGSDSVYYEFSGLPTDSFRVKAAVATFVGTGYIPTYHTSDFYWYNASVIYHTSGTADIYKDINMASGTSSGGPGFIGGNVTTGANRGTSGSVPAVGMNMYLMNSSGAVVQQSTTDASGNYSFPGLAIGTYSVHPEVLSYISTDYVSISLTTETESVENINFIQHTISMTVTPGTTGITPVTPAAAKIEAYPNPASNVLNIQWQETEDEKGTIFISDITGREIYRANVTMNKGVGLRRVDLSGFANGLYLVGVTSGNINYINKLQIAH